MQQGLAKYPCKWVETSNQPQNTENKLGLKDIKDNHYIR